MRARHWVTSRETLGEERRTEHRFLRVKEGRSLGTRRDQKISSESCRGVKGGNCGQEEDAVTHVGSCRWY